MTDNEIILAVDIGTGATKAVAFDKDLRLVSIARKHYPILTPKRGWSEQEPDVIWRGVIEALQELVVSLPDKSHISGISFSSQMYNVLAVDAQGNALTNSLTWADTRAAQIVQEMSCLPEIHSLFKQTGDPIDAIFPFFKILWMKRHLDLPHDVCFITLKDYIIHKLVDQYVVDWSTASASGMFDVRNRSWAEQALDLLHIAPTQLSLPVSPRQIYSSMNREIARHIGLPADTPLIVGGGDGPLASLGVGAADKHILAVNVGSSAAARLITPAPWIDPDEKLYTQIADEDRWVVGGIVSCGGIVYEWFLDSFLVKASAQLTESNLNEIHNFSEREAAGIPAGAEGVFFIPYLAGEQCPGWRSETRGSFWGLDFHHHHGHMARAVLEGITYSIYRIVERIQAMHSTPFSELRVSGGLTSSAVWLQMAADIFGYPIVISATKEGSAQGAAVLAWLALGMKSDYRDFSNRFDEMTRIQPRAEVHNYYRQQYEKFLELLNCSREFT